MANLMTSFNAGVSGLRSAQAALNTTSHNLANAQTTGYVRQQVVITDSFYRNSLGPSDNLLQVGTGTNIIKIRQIRNTFLDAQYRLQVGRQSFYEINRQTTLEVEDLLGEISGAEFSASIGDLKTALSDYAKNPENLVYKEQLVSMAAQFMEFAQTVQTQLTTYQTSLNQEIKEQVDNINSIVSEIKDLNKLIRKYEATGDSANDYRDKRNELLDELSTYINFETNEEIDGTITIFSEGNYLLDSANQYFLGVEYESATSKLLKPVWQNGGDFFRSGSLAFSSEKKTDIGSLRGILVARGNRATNYSDMPVKPNEDDYRNEDGILDSKAYIGAMNAYSKQVEIYNDSVGASVIMRVQAQLDMLVHSVVTLVNDAFSPTKELTLADGSTIRVLDEEKALIGDDEYNTMGTELFSRRSRERYTKTSVEIMNEDGSVEKIDVYKYNEEDPSDPYSLYTISQLVINPTVLKDASTLPSKYNNSSDEHDSYAYNVFESLPDSFNDKIGPLTPGSLTTYNVNDFYRAMVTELSTQGNIWNGIIENQENTVTTLENERQNVMGVSSEEELSDLIKFQRCYDASSRYITTVAEMLEYIIERLGG
ncbi:MAG: flagellar hook-associated protein FlgK [Lachnospiraceae bacterium]|nr:flagellar hook-associated protein FlgK [Lachnospiraceae bacterium]